MFQRKKLLEQRNLSIAIELIDDFLAKESLVLSEGQRAELKDSILPQPIDFLMDLKKHIIAFNHVQKSWVGNAGKLANYYQFSKINANPLVPTQEELDDEILDSIRNGSGFSIKMCEQILKEINICKQNPVYQTTSEKMNGTLFKLFNQIQECAEEVIKNADTVNSILDRYRIRVIEGSIYKLAKSVRAKYIFANQNVDPVADTYIGQCYGYVTQWKKEVAETGQYRSLPRINKEILYAQAGLDSKGDLDPTHSPSKTAYRRKCKSFMEIWMTVDELISQITSSPIYELRWTGKVAGHAMGVRKLTTGEFEFFDPNYGLFVFPDKNAFRIWLNEVLFIYLSNSNDFIISLINRGDQPTNATGTIPLAPQYLDHPEDKNLNFKYLDLKNLDVNFDMENKEDILNEKYTKEDYKNVMDGTDEVLKKLADYKFPKLKFSYDNSIIKSKMTDELDKEIERLKNKFIDFSGYATNKIDALKELKSRIDKANPNDTTIGLIETWLSDIPRGSDKTYESIIKTNHMGKEEHTITFQRICHLVSNYEISLTSMNALQLRLIKGLLNVMENMQKEISFRDLNVGVKDAITTTDKNLSRTMFSLLDRLFNEMPKDSISNIQELLLSLVSRINSISSADIKDYSNISKDFTKVLSNLNLDSPLSLLSTVNFLTDLNSEILNNIKFLDQLNKKNQPQDEVKKIKKGL